MRPGQAPLPPPAAREIPGARSLFCRFVESRTKKTEEATLRLALVANELLPVPPLRGGATHIYVDALARRLAAWHEVTVYSVEDEALPLRSREDGVEFRRLPRESYVPALIEDLKEHPCEVAVVFNRPPWLLPVKKSQGARRLVLSLHNEWLGPRSIPAQKGRQAVTAADAIATVSRYLARRTVERFPEAAPKTRVIYAGADIERFSPGNWPQNAATRRELRREHLLGAAPVLLFVGRLVPAKGLDVLLGALERLASTHPEARLLVVGSPIYDERRFRPYVDALRRQAAALGRRVIFAGFAPPDEIHRFYQAADILVCPSQWQEPLARVVYEGMAAGLPIVASARGGLPEIVQHGMTGILVEDYREPDAYAAALDYLLTHPGAASEMGLRNRRRAEEEYGWEHVARRWQALLSALLPG